MSNIQKQHKISPAIAWLTIQKFIIFYCPLDGEHTTELPGALFFFIIWYYAPMQITAHPTAGWNTLPIPLVQESGSAQSQIFRNGFAAVSNIKRCPSFDFLKSRITLPTLFSAKTAWSNSKYQTGPKTIPYWNTTIPVKKIQGFSFSRLPKFTN